MERSFEAVLVEQCATTLAGVKSASLFRYQGADKRQPREAAARWAKELAPYGITIRVLKYCPQTGACLIYLYRAGWLRSILSEPSTRAFLAGQGYGADQSCQEKFFCFGIDAYNSSRQCSLLTRQEVMSLEAQADREKNARMTVAGVEAELAEMLAEAARVYGDPEAAQKRFDQYRRCTAACCEQFRKGTAITQLIAA